MKYEIYIEDAELIELVGGKIDWKYFYTIRTNKLGMFFVEWKV